jgi:hypothetical protein
MKLTKDHIRDIAVVDFVYLNRDTFAIVPHLDGVCFWLNLNLYQIL